MKVNGKLIECDALFSQEDVDALMGVTERGEYLKREAERIERDGIRSPDDLRVLAEIGDEMVDFDYDKLLESVKDE